MSDKTNPPLYTHIAAGVDLGAAMVAFGSLTQILPTIAAGMAIIWYIIRFISHIVASFDKRKNHTRRKND
jgi:hypothetical protein